MVSSVLCLAYLLAFVFFVQRQQRKNERMMADVFAATEEVDEKDAGHLARSYSRIDCASKECVARISDCRLRRKAADPEPDAAGY